MRILIKSILATLLTAVFATWAYSQESSICDNASLSGEALGLCNA